MEASQALGAARLADAEAGLDLPDRFCSQARPSERGGPSGGPGIGSAGPGRGFRDQVCTASSQPDSAAGSSSGAAAAREPAACALRVSSRWASASGPRFPGVAREARPCGAPSPRLPSHLRAGSFPGAAGSTVFPARPSVPAATPEPSLPVGRRASRTRTPYAPSTLRLSYPRPPLPARGPGAPSCRPASPPDAVGSAVSRARGRIFSGW